MSRISNLTKYPYDYNITEKDFVIGTDGDNKKTKNFPVVALAEYVRNFNNNLSYDRVISIGEITSENNNITINVNDLGNVVYINHIFYTKNTPDTFTFTPVTEGVKVILLYALPDEQIFYMLEGVQSIEAVEPTLPYGAIFVQRIIVTVDGIEIIPNDIIISDNKVQITENTPFAQVGQTQKDFNKNIADEVISLTNEIEVTKTEVNTALATKQANLGFTPENVDNKQNTLSPDGTGEKYTTVDAVNSGLTNKLDKGTYIGTAQSLKNEIDSKQNLLSSFDESILIEPDGNIEGNVSLFQEYFEQQNCVLNFTPIQIIGVYLNGTKQKSSSYTITLPKTISVANFTSGDYIEIQYTKLKI